MALVTSRGLQYSDDGPSFNDIVQAENARRAAITMEEGRTMLEWAELVPERGVPLDMDAFPFQREWYSAEVARARNVVWMKAAQVGMCLRPNTLVLTDALKWVEIGSLRPGDGLVSVDEEPLGKGGVRKLRQAVVNARWDTHRRAVRLHFDDGTTMDCSREHRWLVKRGQHPMAWIAAKDMRAADRVRQVVRPWDDPLYEDGWMAGLLDGEGCLMQRHESPERNSKPARLMITQNDGGVLDRARAYLNANGYTYRDVCKARRVWTLTLHRADEIMRLLGKTQPTRWRRAWWAGQRMFAPRGDHFRELVAIEDLGHCELVDLETSTGTFVAEGLVSHNSGYAWRWAARRAQQFGDRVIYFFPTDDDVTDFGDQRIEPSIKASEFLLKHMNPGDVRHKHLKRIGAGDLALRGTTSRTGVQSVDADALIFDEFEYHDKANLEQAERRTAGSRAAGREPRRRWLGYPLLPNSGIHAMFLRSDAREWHVTCPSCGLEQRIEWNANMRWRSKVAGPDVVLRYGQDEYGEWDDVTEAWRACHECDASLEEAMYTGRWIPRAPGRELIGFHVSRLIVPRTDLIELVQNSRKTTAGAVEAFYNNDLGLPYVSAEAALSEDDVLAACSMGLDRQTQYTGRFPVVAGVDVASERSLSMWIEVLDHDGKSRALWVGEPLDFREVAELIGRFNVGMTVIDSLPERRQARAVAATYPGRVVLAEYEWRNEADAFKYDPKRNIVRINRTEGMDAFMDSIRQLRRLPLRDVPPRFVSQLTSPKRTVEADAKGRRPQRVYVATGPDGDDYAHAGVYVTTAKELWLLKAQVEGQMQQAAGQQVADERFGFAKDPDYTRGYGRGR